MDLDQTRIDEIWAEDLLGRKADGQFLITFLTSRIAERATAKQAGSYVMNINAGWGVGKTFFLDRLRQQLTESKFVAARVDAWRDDHAADPLLPVIGAIETALREAIPAKNRAATAAKANMEKLAKGAGRIALSFGKGIVFQGLRRVAGQEFAQEMSDLLLSKDDKSGSEKVADEVEKVLHSASDKAFDTAEALFDDAASEALSEFEKAQGLIDTFRKELAALVEHLEDLQLERPLFVLIDELDRCRPSYAVELLERVKHLFDVQNVVFVIATDTSQMEQSIKAIYGAGFDSKKYLTRFFDRTFEFETIQPAALLDYLTQTQPVDPQKVQAPMSMGVPAYLSATAFRLGLDPREIKQTYDILRSLVTVWPLKVPMQIGLMFPLIVAFHRGIPLDGDVTLAVFGSAKFTGADPTVKYYPDDDGNWDRARKPRMATLDEMAKSLWDMAKSSLPDIQERERSRAGPSGWAFDVFRQEMQVLYGGRWEANSPPFSVLLGYPAMIRSAGRLISE